MWVLAMACPLHQRRRACMVSLRLPRHRQLPSCPARPSCSSSRNAFSNPAFSKTVEDICSIIRRERKWCPRVEAALAASVPSVHARLLFRVLKLQSDPRIAWRLFHWAGQQPNFSHTPFTFCALIEVLARAKEFEGIWRLLYAMKESGISITPVPFTTLINCYGSVGMVEEANTAFRSMPDFSCKPNVYTYNALLNGQLRAQRTDEALVTLMDMTENGCAPDVATFTMMITSLCRAGELNKALNIFTEMMNKGCAPNTWTFTALIKGLLKVGHKEGNPDKAMELLDQMTGRGCHPDLVTYSILIDGLFKVGRANSALNILRRMIEEGCTPNTDIYSTLTAWLCKEGELENAMESLDWITSRPSNDNSFNHVKLMDELFRAGRADIVLFIVKKMMLNGYCPKRSTCTTLINWLSKEGLTEEMVELLEKMAEQPSG